jgi:hypothetical protein
LHWLLTHAISFSCAAEKPLRLGGPLAALAIRQPRGDVSKRHVKRSDSGPDRLQMAVDHTACLG